jgi:hypothetical protein
VIWLVDRRTHAVLDSAIVRTRGTIRWTAGGDALLAFVGQRGREDHLLRIPATRRLGAPTVALPRVPTLYTGRFDVARRTGRLALTTGDAIQDIWAFDIAGGRATARQVTRGTTWYGGPALSADGMEAYYLRGDAVGDNLHRLRLRDGAEEALTAEGQTGSDVTTLAAGGTVAIYGSVADSSRDLQVTRVELASRRLTRRATPMAPAVAWQLPGGRLILQAPGRWFMADSFAQVSRPRPVPDSLGLMAVAAGPDSSRIAAQLRRGDTTVIALLISFLIPITVLAALRAAGLGREQPELARAGHLRRPLATERLAAEHLAGPGGGRPLRSWPCCPPCEASHIAVADGGRGRSARWRSPQRHLDGGWDREVGGSSGGSCTTPATRLGSEVKAEVSAETHCSPASP